MNEEVIPRLVKMGYLKPGREFKYSNRLEMSNKDKIDLYTFLTKNYRVPEEEIEKEFGVCVGEQLNLEKEAPAPSIINKKKKRSEVVNFLTEEK